MRLTDVMSHSGLTRYAEIGLVLFVVAFVLIAARVLWPSRKEEIERDRFLPLDDDDDRPPTRPKEGVK